MKKILRFIFYILFVVYMYLLIYILILSRGQHDVGSLSFVEYIVKSSNFIPLKGILGYIHDLIFHHTGTNALYNLIGNLIMCFPLGVYLTLFLKRKSNSKRIIFATFFIIFILEMIQLIQYRGSFDIDDILLNVLGAWVGYLLLQSKSIIKIIQVLFGEEFYESY